MASTNAELFAIESAIQGLLHPNSAGEGVTDNDIELDYVNTFSFSQSEDSLKARADGKPKITLKGNKEMTFTVEAEVLNEGALLFLLGGTKGVDGKITVGSTPIESYTYTGTAKLVYADGHKEVKDITIPNCTPQLGDFGTSSLDLQTFSITFDCGTDEDGNFLTMVDHVDAP